MPESPGPSTTKIVAKRSGEGCETGRNQCVYAEHGAVLFLILDSHYFVE